MIQLTPEMLHAPMPDGSDPRCGPSARHGSRWPAQAEFPVPVDAFPVPRKGSLFRKEQGISRRLFKPLRDFASASAKAALTKQAEIGKIPCYFPCFQGIQRCRGQGDATAERIAGRSERAIREFDAARWRRSI